MFYLFSLFPQVKFYFEIKTHCALKRMKFTYKPDFVILKLPFKKSIACLRAWRDLTDTALKVQVKSLNNLHFRKKRLSARERNWAILCRKEHQHRMEFYSNESIVSFHFDQFKFVYFVRCLHLYFSIRQNCIHFVTIEIYRYLFHEQWWLLSAKCNYFAYRTVRLRLWAVKRELQ